MRRDGALCCTTGLFAAQSRGVARDYSVMMSKAKGAASPRQADSTHGEQTPAVPHHSARLHSCNPSGCTDCRVHGAAFRAEGARQLRWGTRFCAMLHSVTSAVGRVSVHCMHVRRAAQRHGRGAVPSCSRCLCCHACALALGRATPALRPRAALAPHQVQTARARNQHAAPLVASETCGCALGCGSVDAPRVLACVRRARAVRACCGAGRC